MTKKSTLLLDIGTCGPIQFKHPLEDGVCGRCQLVDHSRTRTFYVHQTLLPPHGAAPVPRLLIDRVYQSLYPGLFVL